MSTVEQVAETVLYEGYLLFPYRQSAMKNQQRWTFGGVYPRRYSETSSGDDPWVMQTECLIVAERPRDAGLEVKVRFLHVVQRDVAEKVGGGSRSVDRLQVGDQVYRPWEEAVERQILLGTEAGTLPPLSDLVGHPQWLEIAVPEGSAEEPLIDPRGQQLGSLVRRWQPLQGAVEVEAKPVEAIPRCYRLTVRIANTTPWPPSSQRDASRLRRDVLPQTFISTHTILRIQGGRFVSLLEPAEEYREAAGACRNLKTWPVLAGEKGEQTALLSSPIILYDYPEVSPESPGDLFDATEIDELLRLSIMTLTDEEKQAMREADNRSRQILEETELLSPEELMKLHGAIRSLEPMGREEE